MNAMLRLAIASSVLTLLAGCAASREMTSSPPPAQQELTAEQQYIAYVERVAKRRGIQLTWVNPPRFAEKAKEQ